MAIQPWNPVSSGGGGGGVPPPFSYVVNAQGELELWQDSQKIAVQSVDGAWFADNVSTGVGSLHLGGSESGGLAHSISSTGQNVGFKNEFSRANEDQKLFFFPAWQGMTIDGADLVAPSVLVFGAKTTVQPNGAPHASNTSSYNFVITPSTNSVTTKVVIVAAENYSGVLDNVIISTITGAEIYSSKVDVAVGIGELVTIDYKYPFFIRAGDSLRIQLKKADGSFLQCRSGQTDTSIPFRNLQQRPFTDSEILSFGEPSKVARSLEQLTGNDRLDASAVKNLDIGGYQGLINFGGNLSQFANAKKGYFWKASTSGSIGGLTFQVGDQLYVKADTTGTPANLTDANIYVINPNSNAIATPTLAGMVKPQDGLDVAADGTLTVKIGAGLQFNGTKHITVNPSQIDVFSLANVGLLNKGNYRGDIPATAAGLANAAKGDWWKASTGKTLLGTSFATGDELYCVNAQAGTPTDLSNFVKVANTQSVMIGANGTQAGVTGTVPVPAATDNNKALFGDATYKEVIRPTDVVNTLVGTATDKPLSAAQGKALKDSLDALPSNAAPAALAASAAIGTSTRFARQDHAHALPSVATTSANGLMSSTDKAKLDGFSSFNTSAATALAATASAGTSTVPARVDHVHPLPANATTSTSGLMSSSDKTKLDGIVGYAKCGLDFTVSTNPSRVYRDLIWCSAAGGATVQAANVPWIVANQADADRLAAYWIQQITTFFKDLENDTQYDQLIGAIPSASGIASKLASGTIAVAPSASSDMDNQMSIGTGINYATEWFELVVGANAAGTELYTMWLNIALVSSGSSTNTLADVMYPFRLVYQTTANQTLASFPATAVSSISSATPRTTARATSFTASGNAFLLCAEPVSIECRR